MSLHRLAFAKAFPRFSLALALFASTLHAQGNGQTLFEWRGRVDREVEITMRGRDAWATPVGRNETRLARPVVSTALPQEDGIVNVRIEDGRGDVRVVQQPSRQNDYTAIVRLTDRSGGADSYRVSAYWLDRNNRDDSGYGWDNGRNGRDDRGRDDRGRDDRGRDDQGGWDRGNGRDDRGNDRGNSGWGWGNGRGVQNVLRWSGEVDDGLEIRIQGNQITYRRLSGKGTRDVRADFARGGLPRQNVDLRIRERTGRGDVYVVQEPNARNGYTAIIRITDPRPSYGFYDFELMAARNGNGWGRNGR